MWITKVIIKLRKKYDSWCRAGYELYRELGESKYRAWKGAFILNNDWLLKKEKK